MPPRVALGLAGLAVASAITGSATGGSLTALLLVLVQTAGVATLVWSGLRFGRGWATATVVLAAAWIALFLIPSAVYAVSPHYASPYAPAGAIAVVDVSLFSLLAGVLLAGRQEPSAGAPQLMQVKPANVSVRRVVAWFGVGLAGLAALMVHAGGPAAYLTNIDATAGLNAGLFYVVWVALTLRFAPFALVLGQWATRGRVTRLAIVLTMAGLALLLLTGARSFIAVGLVQLVLAAALVRRPIPLLRIAPAAIAVAVVLVFGLGTVKRHQTYNTQHPEAPLSLLAYAKDVAPSSAVDAYVNNYVDTVRLIAMARATVPSKAPYEGARPLLQLLMKPIPSSLRPELDRDPAIKSVFEPEGDYAYAEPLQVTAFLAGGPLAVALAFLLLGFGVARLDGWLAADRPRHMASVAGAIALCVQIPVLLRSGVPNGVAFLGIEVLGSAGVMWSVAQRRRSWRRPGRVPRGRRVDPAARRWTVGACLLAAVLLALVAFTSMADNPVLGIDSSGYLANARLMAGVGVKPIQYGQHYAFGYSLPLTIPYLFTTDWLSVYRFAIAFNVGCAVLTVLGAQVLVREWFGLSRRGAALVALVVVAIPYVSLETSLVWAEAALTMTLTWWCVFLERFLRQPTRGAAASLVSTAVLLFALHNRMAVVGAVTALAVLLVLRRQGRRLWIVGAAGSLGLLAVFATDRAISRATTPVGSAGGAGSAITDSLSHLPELVLRALGAGWALGVGTLGLAVLGLVHLCRRDSGLRSAPFLLVAVALLSLLSAAFLTGAQADTGFTRADWLVYERYLAPFGPALVGIACGALVTGGLRRAWLAPAALTVVTGLLVADSGAEAAGAVALVNIPGVSALSSLVVGRAANPDHVALAFSGFAAAAVVLTFLLARRSRLVLPAAAVLLAALTVSGATGFRAYGRFWSPTATSTPSVLSSVPTSYPVAYDVATVNADYLNRYQLFEPERRFLLFDSRTQPPPAGLVVTGPDWSEADRYLASPVTVEALATQVLWRLGSTPPGRVPPPSWTQLRG